MLENGSMFFVCGSWHRRRCRLASVHPHVCSFVRKKTQTLIAIYQCGKSLTNYLHQKTKNKKKTILLHFFIYFKLPFHIGILFGSLFFLMERSMHAHDVSTILTCFIIIIFPFPHTYIHHIRIRLFTFR